MNAKPNASKQGGHARPLTLFPVTVVAVIRAFTGATIVLTLQVYDSRTQD
jgi:hypothetical protein